MKKRKKMKKIFSGIVTAALAVTFIPASLPETVSAAPPASRVSVHDPSIFKDPADDTYYVLGSHIASASSEDLVSWEQISTDYGDTSAAPLFSV